MDLGLGGRGAVVTGGSLGIGRAVVLELAREGASVMCVARNAANLAETVRQAEGLEGRVIPVEQDCSEAAAAQVVVAQAKEALGRIDILVNNLGNGWLGHDWRTEDETWEYVMNFNLYSAVRFARESIPQMQENGYGRIINMSSVSGHSGFPEMGDYNASKAAMIMWSKTISRELAPAITVNSLCPACIATPLWDNLAKQLTGVAGETVEEVYENVAKENLVLGRYGTPEEVSGLCAFLASERAAFITGVAYNVDGGFTNFAF